VIREQQQTQGKCLIRYKPLIKQRACLFTRSTTEEERESQCFLQHSKMQSIAVPLPSVFITLYLCFFSHRLKAAVLTSGKGMLRVLVTPFLLRFDEQGRGKGRA
jgi:hypothetical protein